MGKICWVSFYISSRWHLQILWDQCSYHFHSFSSWGHQVWENKPLAQNTQLVRGVNNGKQRNLTPELEFFSTGLLSSLTCQSVLLNALTSCPLRASQVPPTRIFCIMSFRNLTWRCLIRIGLLSSPQPSCPWDRSSWALVQYSKMLEERWPLQLKTLILVLWQSCNFQATFQWWPAFHSGLSNWGENEPINW